MEFHILELKKLPKELKESDDLLLWAKFISSERKEDFEMLATQNKYIESAYRELQVISQDKQKRLEYEAREKAIRDHNQMMFEAKESGREEGIEIGEARINKLNAILIQNKRYADLERATNDKEVQRQLMSEYDI